MPLSKEFQDVFQDGIRRMQQQNEAARNELEDFLGQLRQRTEMMMAQGASPQPVPPIPIKAPEDPSLQRSESTVTLNQVGEDWVRTVVQAASIDTGFMMNTGATATQIVMSQLQQPKPADPGEVPKPADPG